MFAYMVRVIDNCDITSIRSGLSSFNDKDNNPGLFPKYLIYNQFLSMAQLVYERPNNDEKDTDKRTLYKLMGTNIFSYLAETRKIKRY